jgi:hypothetical protein
MGCGATAPCRRSPITGKKGGADLADVSDALSALPFVARILEQTTAAEPDTVLLTSMVSRLRGSVTACVGFVEVELSIAGTYAYSDLLGGLPWPAEIRRVFTLVPVQLRGVTGASAACRRSGPRPTSSRPTRRTWPRCSTSSPSPPPEHTPAPWVAPRTVTRTVAGSHGGNLPRVSVPPDAASTNDVLGARIRSAELRQASSQSPGCGQRARTSRITRSGTPAVMYPATSAAAQEPGPRALAGGRELISSTVPGWRSDAPDPCRTYHTDRRVRPLPSTRARRPLAYPRPLGPPRARWSHAVGRARGYRNACWSSVTNFPMAAFPLIDGFIPKLPFWKRKS